MGLINDSSELTSFPPTNRHYHFSCSCDFVENFGPPNCPSRVLTNKPFRKLQVLVCISESAPNVIEFLLVNADQLKRVQFGSTAWFNDATVANVLSKVREHRFLPPAQRRGQVMLFLLLKTFSFSAFTFFSQVAFFGFFTSATMI